MVSHICRKCAESAFAIWKGWCSYGTERWSESQKRATAIPDVPAIHESECPRCGSSEKLLASDVRYLNIHGPYNTGLPDYFILVIAPNTSEKWGKPYQDSNVPRIPIDMVQEFVKELYPYG